MIGKQSCRRCYLIFGDSPNIVLNSVKRSTCSGTWATLLWLLAFHVRVSLLDFNCPLCCSNPQRAVEPNRRYYSFTGFIHRMRGYYSTRDKLPGYEKGVLPTSYYYVPVNHRGQMHQYAALHGAFFNREFPTSWRDLDKGIGRLLPRTGSTTAEAQQ